MLNDNKQTRSQGKGKGKRPIQRMGRKEHGGKKKDFIFLLYILFTFHMNFQSNLYVPVILDY